MHGTMDIKKKSEYLQSSSRYQIPKIYHFPDRIYGLISCRLAQHSDPVLEMTILMTITLIDFCQSVWQNVTMAPEVKLRPLLLLIIVKPFRAV